MAKIKFGMMMTDARGKLGGQVFSKNRSGAYVRTKVTPVNPKTSYQQENRSLLGQMSAGWSDLKETQRAAWNGAVSDWQKTNIFGDLQKPTGKNLYTSLNKVLSQNFPESDIMVLPPRKANFLNFVLVSGTASFATGVSVHLSGAGSGLKTFSVRATAPLSPAVDYVENQLRGIGTAFTSLEDGTIDLGSQYISRFGAITTDKAISVEVRQVADNGQLGVPQIVKIIAT